MIGTACHAAVAAALVAALGACAAAPARGRRPYEPVVGGRWAGRGICYGPHRDGQRPGGAGPSRAQLREDLTLLAGRWDVLRLYGSDGPAPEVLAIIREERLPFRVLLGAWLEPEARPGAGASNRAQVEAAARLGEEYPDLVAAVIVGNETQVAWSDHRMPAAELLAWVREARRLTSRPVGTADDFLFWIAPESEVVSRELDLVLAHVHPLWNGRSLDEALAFTEETYAAVRRRHPGLPVVLGETGWATRSSRQGDQARLIRGDAGEESQRRFHEIFRAWADRERVPSAWFEAFDEAWKGGDDPDDAEKHWGLWRADRTPKPAVR
jgi:exo-beta-1,3-glucanase (GH17 family)